MGAIGFPRVLQGLKHSSGSGPSTLHRQGKGGSERVQWNPAVDRAILLDVAVIAWPADGARGAASSWRDHSDLIAHN
jgi:hypothetical protein